MSSYHIELFFAKVQANTSWLITFARFLINPAYLQRLPLSLTCEVVINIILSLITTIKCHAAIFLSTIWSSLQTDDVVNGYYVTKSMYIFDLCARNYPPSMNMCSSPGFLVNFGIFFAANRTNWYVVLSNLNFQYRFFHVCAKTDIIIYSVPFN